MSSWLLSLLLLSGSGLCLVLMMMILFKWSSRRSSNKLRRPPGPRGLPIIGNLHMLGTLPHHDLARLAKQYGTVFYMRLGFNPTVVISSPSAAEQVLKTHDVLFANRPKSEIFTYMAYGLKNFAYTSYGLQWRSLRKLTTTGLLSSARLEATRAVRAEETDNLVAAMREAGAAVNLIAMLRECMGDAVCRVVVGRKFMRERVGGVTFAEQFEQVRILLTAFDLSSCMPAFVASLDPQGLLRRAKKVRAVLDEFFERIIDEHLANKAGAGREPDFLDFLLSELEAKNMEFQIDREHVKAVTKDIFEGALNTTPMAVEWAFSEILRKPRVMKKIKEELANVVGPARAVEESDLPKLDYLGMVVKEVLRLHPISPFLFRYNKEDCVVDNFLIPAGCTIFINIWATARDPEVWPDADEFTPERFADKNIDFRGLNYSFLPFGSGRRICPGLQFGHIMILLMLAKLLHYFDWELPNGMSPTELDMEETYRRSVRRTNPLILVPKPCHSLTREK